MSLVFLPHRDPFLFIDSVDVGDAPGRCQVKSLAEVNFKNLLGSKIVAFFHVHKDLYLFHGHFPGNPILPGVIQVEMMAQAACFPIYHLWKALKDTKLNVALAHISRAKFRKPVVPGMDLRIETKCCRVRGPMLSNECLVISEGEVMSECQILASVKLEKANEC